jgi:hypothetical protein
MATTYLSKTFGSAGNQKTWTWSGWIKRGTITTTQVFFTNYTSSSTRQYFRFNSSDQFETYGVVGGTDIIQANTTSVFRDVSAWYHVVVVFNTTESTGSNRCKVYINGVQQSLTFTTTPGLDADGAINDNGLHSIGNNGNGGNYVDGSMAMVQFVDGQAYDATYFGSTDSTTGIWTSQASSTISSYGTNGFKLAMDTTTPGADTSGNTNNFTASGTPTLTQGSPSNVFCIMNSLDNFYAGSTLSNGNNTVATVSGNAAYNPSNFAIKTGKWYWEVKLVACSNGNGSEATIIGMSNQSPTSSGYNGSIQGSGGLGIRGNGKMWNGAGGPEETGWSAIAVGNIAMIAVDFDNGKFYAGINGTWGNSGDPTSGSTGTGAFSFTVGSDVWFMAVNQRETSQTATFSLNFGEGFFGTTAAGTQADDNGQGLFAYDVPAGYYALNTKNLEAYG